VGKDQCAARCQARGRTSSDCNVRQGGC